MSELGVNSTFISSFLICNVFLFLKKTMNETTAASNTTPPAIGPMMIPRDVLELGCELVATLMGAIPSKFRS